MQEQDKNDVTNQDRRKAIKKIAVGVGVVAGYSVLPEKWTKPVVGQMILPAHAETSGAPAAAATAPAGDGTYNSSETFSMKFADKRGGKQYSWLAQTGAHDGGPVKFVFGNGCGELHVPDAKVTHGADGNTSNHNQMFYFCGTDFKPGVPEYNAGKASVFAGPGCRAGHGTIHYNKQYAFYLLAFTLKGSCCFSAGAFFRFRR